MRPESGCIHNFGHNENPTLRQTVAPQRGAWITEAMFYQHATCWTLCILYMLRHLQECVDNTNLWLSFDRFYWPIEATRGHMIKLHSKMATYLAVPLKKTWDVDFVKPLQTFIANTFSDASPEEYRHGAFRIPEITFVDDHQVSWQTWIGVGSVVQVTSYSACHCHWQSRWKCQSVVTPPSVYLCNIWALLRLLLPSSI